MDVEHVITRADDHEPLVAALAREAPALHGHDSLDLEDGARPRRYRRDEGLPVLDEHEHVIGWLTHRRLLRAYRERVDRQL